MGSSPEKRAKKLIPASNDHWQEANRGTLTEDAPTPVLTLVGLKRNSPFLASGSHVVLHSERDRGCTGVALWPSIP